MYLESVVRFANEEDIDPIFIDEPVLPNEGQVEEQVAQG